MLRRQTSETTNSLSVLSESVPSLGFFLAVASRVLETLGFEGESQLILVRLCVPRARFVSHPALGPLG